MSTATEDGHELFVVCVDRDSGKIMQDIKLFDVAKPQFCIPFNSYASPTPVIEERRLYVSFGAPGLACVDTENSIVLCTRGDLVCNHVRAPGHTSVLCSNLLP